MKRCGNLKTRRLPDMLYSGKTWKTDFEAVWKNYNGSNMVSIYALTPSMFDKPYEYFDK